MHKKHIFAKKVYISILTAILVMLTTVATTYAWVGVLANSTFEKFDVKIQTSDLNEYGIEISVDGIHFYDSLDFDDVVSQIEANWTDTKKQSINGLLNQDQCTTVPKVVDGKIVSFGAFTDLTGNPTTRLYKFDIYVSPKKIYDQDMSSEYYLDVYLQKNMLSGNYMTRDLMNSFTYPSDFVNPFSNSLNLPAGCSPVLAGTKISSAKINSADAARVGFEKYKVVDKYHPEMYVSETPNSAVIYQDSLEYPVYNQESNSYSFGGILPDAYNLSTGYYNSTERFVAHHSADIMVMPDAIASTRSVNGVCPDLVLSSTTNHLIDSTNSDEKIGVNQMMKMTVYFWFEGWDADCFNAINASPVDINIAFSLSNDEEF